MDLFVWTQTSTRKMAIKLAKRIRKIKRCISNGSQSNNIKTEHRMWQIFVVFITNIPVAPHRPMLFYSPAFFPYIDILFGKTNENTFRSNIHQYHILYRSFVITFYLFILWGSETQCARVYAKRQMDLFTQASHDVYCIPYRDKCEESHKSESWMFAFVLVGPFGWQSPRRHRYNTVSQPNEIIRFLHFISLSLSFRSFGAQSSIFLQEIHSHTNGIQCYTVYECYEKNDH